MQCRRRAGREKGTAKRIPEGRAEKDGLGWTGVKKRRREGDKNGNLFERSEFISVQPEEGSFSSRRRSLDFSFCELFLFIKKKKKWVQPLGKQKTERET